MTFDTFGLFVMAGFIYYLLSKINRGVEESEPTLREQMFCGLLREYAKMVNVISPESVSVWMVTLADSGPIVVLDPSVKERHSKNCVGENKLFGYSGRSKGHRVLVIAGISEKLLGEGIRYVPVNVIYFDLPEKGCLLRGSSTDFEAGQHRYQVLWPGRDWEDITEKESDRLTGFQKSD